jgi:TonB family protein
VSELTGFPGSNGGVALRLPGPRLVRSNVPPSLQMFRGLSVSPESRNRSRLSFVFGLLADILLVEAIVLMGVSTAHQVATLHKHYTVTWLRTEASPPHPAVEPKREVARVTLPKMTIPETDTPPVIPPPVTHIDPPKVNPDIPPVVHEPAPRMQTYVPPQPAPKVQEPVKTGLFGGGAPERVTTNRPLDQVQTGGFGSPAGLSGHAEGDSAGNVPKVGLFGLPEGPGVGNGTGGAHGIQGVVASAGFGSGVAGPGGVQGTHGVVARAGFGSGAPGQAGATNAGPVAVGGFAKTLQAAQPVQANAPPPAPEAFQSIEILSKPAPIYTEEATRLGIQGEVVLSVIFQANGTISVLGVTQSLGHGLDEAARAAAAQIRFKPAQRAGRPVDFPATLRIQFRLANQS